MKLPFTPTWKKVADQKAGFKQFYYIHTHDVEKEWKNGFDQLNEGRKMAARFYWLISELNNGGLDQYFWNSSGDFFTDSVEDLNRIGQHDAAAILTRASRKLFGDAEVPSDTSLRRAAIQSYYGTHPFNDDDDRERLAVLEEKENLEKETRLLDELQRPMAIALVDWMRQNHTMFSRLHGKDEEKDEAKVSG